MASNLSKNHESDREVSAVRIMKESTGLILALQILEGAILAEHHTKIPALLICVSGEVVFEDKNGFSLTMNPGDTLNIVPLVKHWVKGIKNSQLILIR